MNKSLSCFLLLALLVGPFYQAMADGSMYSPHASDFPFRSPEASSFLRYGEYEVGEYTGNPQISVPLYTLKCRDIELPITLTYQGGGIRVDEEASWVGLGWNLAIGGCINYIPAGSLDYFPRIATWNEYQAFYNQLYLPYFLTDENINQIPSSLYTDLQNGLGERDFYSVTVLGKAFLFFINPLTNQPEVIGNENTHYIITLDSSDNWTITDDMGFVYEFMNKEYSTDNNGHDYLAAWYLSTITSPQGGSVNFYYSDTSTVICLTKTYQQFDYPIRTDVAVDCSYTSTPDYPHIGFFEQGLCGSNYLSKSYLSSIEAEGITITFTLGDREDIAGTAKRLSGIQVLSTLDNNVVRSFTFNYSYFTATNTGGSYLEVTSNNLNYISKRLKLLSVEDGISTIKQTYTFEYEESHPLPYKTSYSTDFWGYYNGQSNLTDDDYFPQGYTFVPTPILCFLGKNELDSLPLYLRTRSWADRFSRREYILSGTLKKIIYPTKGYTVFTHEPHTFEDTNHYPEGTADFQKTYDVIDINYAGTNGGPTFHQQITLEKDYVGFLRTEFKSCSTYSLRQMLVHGASVNIYPLGVNTSPIVVNLVGVSDATLDNDLKYTILTPVSLPAGSYMFVAGLPEYFGSGTGMYVEGALSLYKSSDITPSVGAGLRIKEIANYEADGTLLEKTEYSYVKENGSTSGKLLYPVGACRSFKRNCITFYSGNDLTCYSERLYEVMRFSNSGGGIPTFTTMLANGTVGYSRVVKKHTYGGDGYTISYYANEAAQNKVVDLYAFSESFNNGALQKRVCLTENGDTAYTESYRYSILLPTYYKVNVLYDGRYIGPYGMGLYGWTGTISQCYCQVFPYMKFWRPLIKKVTKEYSGGTPTRSIVHDYEYNTTNRQLSRDVFWSSDGKKFIAELKYPTDFPNDNTLSCMAQRNIIRPVVQQSLYLVNGATETLLQQKKTVYTRKQSNFPDVFVPLKEQFAPSGGALEDRIVYSHDTKGNITGFVQDGTTKQAWLWAYNSTYPVVKVEGASYAEVQSWLGASTIQALASNSTSVASALSSIRSSLASHDVLVSTYEYLPMIGICKETNPHGESHTYSYDTFGRLTEIKDNGNYPIEQYVYHYHPSFNYIRKRTMLNTAGSNYIDMTSYFDGIGRPYEEVTKTIYNNVLNNADTVTATFAEYDSCGRITKKWLPAKISGDHVGLTDFRNAAMSSYGGDPRPFEEVRFEPSPLARTERTCLPGVAWTSHPVRNSYLFNDASDSLRCLFYSIDNNDRLAGGTSYYDAGTLSVTRTEDADGIRTFTFTDNFGRTVLTRAMDGALCHDTYSVYDDYGNLRYALQPMYQTAADTSLYAFIYRYDSRNRCIYKKQPGCAPVYCRYDTADRLSFSQDGNQRADGRWTFYEYDGLSRLVRQGECLNRNLNAIVSVLIENSYDSKPSFYSGSYNSTYSKGQLTGTKAKILGTDDNLQTIYTYDVKGRVTYEQKISSLGEKCNTQTSYSFTGSPSTVYRYHYQGGSLLFYENYSYTYDHAGRVSQVSHSNNGTSVVLANYAYDAFGRLRSKTLGGNTANTIIYGHDLHGWLTDIRSSLFSQSLHYADGPGIPRYNGSISSLTWQEGNDSYIYGYKYSYDGLGRLTQASFGLGAGIVAGTIDFSEKGITYDKNGNILTLKRYGLKAGNVSFGLLDNLTMTLTGNRVTRVIDASANTASSFSMAYVDRSNATVEREYDENGNMTKDLDRNICSIRYNALNLPDSIILNSGAMTTFLYSADGTKLQMKVTTAAGSSTVTKYMGNLVYENGVASRVLTGEGYLNRSNGTYHFFLTDHQGNVRVVTDAAGSQAEEVNHYYPFGALFVTSTNVQPYKYNGKEAYSQQNLDLYDYGARLYDPLTARFTTSDPLCEKYYPLSPYAYCANNPVSLIDPDGREIWIDDGNNDAFQYSIGMNHNDNLFVKRLNELSTTKAGKTVVSSLVSSDIKYTFTNKSTNVDGTGAGYVPEKHELRLNNSNTLGFAEETFHAYQHYLGEPLRTAVAEVDAHIFASRMVGEIKEWFYLDGTKAWNYLSGTDSYNRAFQNLLSSGYNHSDYSVLVSKFYSDCTAGMVYLQKGYKETGIIKKKPLPYLLNLLPLP